MEASGQVQMLARLGTHGRHYPQFICCIMRGVFDVVWCPLVEATSRSKYSDVGSSGTARRSTTRDDVFRSQYLAEKQLKEKRPPAA